MILPRTQLEIPMHTGPGAPPGDTCAMVTPLEVQSERHVNSTLIHAFPPEAPCKLACTTPVLEYPAGYAKSRQTGAPAPKFVHRNLNDA
eukprot:1082290-Rhodomonas_salina.1